MSGFKLTSHALCALGGVVAGVGAYSLYQSLGRKSDDGAEKPSPSAVSVVTPATAWPAGKPKFTDMEAYPDWDDSDQKGSFLKICHMLIQEVGLKWWPGHPRCRAGVGCAAGAQSGEGL